METLGLFVSFYGALFLIVLAALRFFWDSLSSEIRAVGKVFL